MSYEFVNAADIVDCSDVNEDGSINCKRYSSLIKEFYNDTPVISKELTPDGQAWKIVGKLRTYNPEEDLTSDEYVNSMSDWVNYVSSYDYGYIGTEETYDFLRAKGIIMIQKAEPQDNTASIGYSPIENKWYGWSHRAMYGFTIGDVVKKGDLTATSGLIEEYRIQHPDEDMSLPVGFKAETMKDAKRMAIAFANAVS